MKILVAVAALFLVGCGHAMTKMDRELALKLADKSPVIVQSAPPIINVNNFNGSQQRQPMSESSSEYSAFNSENNHENVRPEAVAEAYAAQQNCVNSPIYNWEGQLVRTVRKCFGAK